jgi:stage II sporulation protein D
MEKKDKMKWIVVGLLVLAACSVVLTIVLVAVLVHPTEGEAETQAGSLTFSEDVNGVLENAYIVSNEEQELVVLYRGTYYLARGTAEAAYTGVADLWLENGKIKKISAKSSAIEGVLASYTESTVQIEGYEPLACAGSLPVYYRDGAGEGIDAVQQIAVSDLIIGTSEVRLVVANGQACAIVKRESDNVDSIRVLLKNGSETAYDALYVVCDAACTVDGKKRKAGKVLSAAKCLKGQKDGSEIRISPQGDGLLYLCNKKGEKLTEGYEGDFILRKAAEGYVLINDVPMETYLCYVLPSEMPTGFSYEALKAQAVCARTYAYRQLSGDSYAAYGANLDDSTAYQVYHATTRYEVTDRAVEETAGEVLTCEGELADCYYFSTSAGYSENLEVWGKDSPSYLVAENHTETATQNLSRKKVFHQFITEAVESYDADSPYYRWTATISARLGMDEEYGLLKSISVDKRSSSGYILALTVVFDKGERTYTKENDIRSALGKYVVSVTLQDGTVRTDLHSVPSACFEVTSQKDGEIVLSGGGFGHGIGMSQYGADAMGREGKSYSEILAYYYKGAAIQAVGKNY